MNKSRARLTSHARREEEESAFRSKFYDSSARQLLFRATSLSFAANVGGSLSPASGDIRESLSE